MLAVLRGALILYPRGGEITPTIPTGAWLLEHGHVDNNMSDQLPLPTSFDFHQPLRTDAGDTVFKKTTRSFQR